MCLQNTQESGLMRNKLNAMKIRMVCMDGLTYPLVKNGGHNSTGLGSKLIAGSGKWWGSAVKFLQFINFTTSILKHV